MTPEELKAEADANNRLWRCGTFDTEQGKEALEYFENLTYDPQDATMTIEDMEKTIKFALELDPDLAAALARIGYPPPRQREPGFATLLRIVTAQQVSVASAAAIWRKLERLFPDGVNAEGVLALADADLRAVGFSDLNIADIALADWVDLSTGISPWAYPVPPVPEPQPQERG